MTSTAPAIQKQPENGASKLPKVNVPVKETTPSSSDEKKKQAPSSSDEKKKQAPYLERPVKVKNAADVDSTVLLRSMLKHSQQGLRKWRRHAIKFKVANMTLTALVILLQVAQVILLQIPEISTSDKTALSTIFPSFTGGLVALQLKLSWAEKGTKCKKAARLYTQLTKHFEYRLQMHEAGGITEDLDSVKIWNAAMLSDSKDVPAFLSCC